MVVLSFLLAIEFIKITIENPRLFLGIGNYSWDRFIELFQPKRNYSILEKPENQK
jgi:hypothetical protein